MIDQLERDYKNNPMLFKWNGKIKTDALEEWISERDYRVPAELFNVWADTGGGDLFETETILGPFADPETADDVESVNEYHRSRGLPELLFVFHTGGAKISAVREDG